MDQKSFQKKYDSYVSRYERENRKVEEVKTKITERLRKADQVSAFMFEIHEREGLIEEFDGKLWISTIESVLVRQNGELEFKFKNGMEVSK